MSAAGHLPHSSLRGSLNSSKCPEGHEERLHGIDEQGAHEPGSDIHNKPILGNTHTLVTAVRNFQSGDGTTIRPGSQLGTLGSPNCFHQVKVGVFPKV